MAAEFDTQPNYTNDEDPAPQPDRGTTRDSRGLWGTLALLALVAIVVFVLLNQLTARVPNTVGLSRDDAEARLTKAGFAVGDVSEVPAAATRPGFVQDQAPVAGVMVRKGASIDLMVALGGNLATVPDVSGRDAANASVVLMQAGFEVANAEQYSDTVPYGAAVEQSPPGGSKAANGSTVAVYYSLGPQSSAEVAVLPSDTGDGMTDATRGTTGSGTDSLVMNCTRAYPGVSAWSSNGDIYVRLTPGGASRRVTSTGDWDTDPVISPSRKYLVFLRAPGPGQRAGGVGAVCFTTFKTHMLAMPETTPEADKTRFYGRPVFAPSENSTRANTDWIVFPQFWLERRDASVEQPSARLLICNVPIDSKWVSWNLQFRPAHTLTVGDSSRAGCVRVTQKSGSTTIYSRDFNVTTGLYPH